MNAYPVEVEATRCAECRKLFNLGERKCFREGSSSATCQQCYFAKEVSR